MKLAALLLLAGLAGTAMAAGIEDTASANDGILDGHVVSPVESLEDDDDDADIGGLGRAAGVGHSTIAGGVAGSVGSEATGE